MMANTSLNVQTDSGKAERACAWCGNRFSFGQSNRTLCSNRCKKARYNHHNRTKINAKQRERNKTKQGREATVRYKEKRKAKMRADRHRKLKQWPKNPKICSVYFHRCSWCDDVFAHSMPHAKFCSAEHKTEMKRYLDVATGRKARRDKKYRSKHSEKLLRYYRERDHAKRRADPVGVRQMERERERRRAAQAALSAILPVYNQGPNQ